VKTRTGTGPDAKPGDWVQIRIEQLQLHERTSGLPPETGSVPYIVLVKGFALSQAVLGDAIRITTPAERELKGTLVAVDLAHAPTFGSPVPELGRIGSELRRILESDLSERSTK
jgi:hypothetical protein